jgi:hypothetical protein
VNITTRQCTQSSIILPLASPALNLPAAQFLHSFDEHPQASGSLLPSF